MGYTNDFFNGFIKWGVLLPDLRFFGYTGMEKSTGRDVDLYFLGVMFFGAASPTIPENDDLDNYIAAGAYHVAAANIAKNIGNVPYASAGGSLFVITAYSGSNYIIQIYICIRGIYGRKKQSNSWSEWINICTFT